MPRTFGWARSVPWCHYAREWAKKTLLLIRLLLGLVRGDPETAAADSRALADIVSRYDLPAWWAGWVTFLQGWAKWSDGAGESSTEQAPVTPQTCAHEPLSEHGLPTRSR